MKINYPPSPISLDPKLLEPNAQFKKEVISVLSGIVFFIVVYIALISAAIVLAILCGYLGLMLMASLRGFLIIIAGVAVICFGLLILAFLLKFIFAKKQTDRNNLIEITEENEPDLFEFIRKINAETKSPRPKKIYISPEVNAYVFYNSSFWSMFFPTKKNLVVGLGLVNTLNISEFKAVIAHEFGHFSQSSMKLGSYVYNVNYIIYDMLYNNNSYNNLLQMAGQIHIIFTLIVELAAAVARGLQWVLQAVYGVINKKYMGLSRQMEFHADAISASVSGGSHLISALEKLELSGASYQQLLQQYDSWIPENKRPDNIYSHHKTQNIFLAKANNLDIVNDMPVIDKSKIQNFTQSQIIIKNQWASHPSNDERAAELNRLQLHTDTIQESAWLLFKNPEVIQREVTDHIYMEIQFKNKPDIVNAAQLVDELNNNKKTWSFPEVFGDFYDGRNFYTAANPKDVGLTVTAKTWSDFFTPENIKIPKTVQQIKDDIQLLDFISNKKSGIKSFDFNGNKYDRKHTTTVKDILQSQLEGVEKKLTELENNILAFVYNKMQADEAEQFLQKLEELKSLDKETDEHLAILNELITVLQPFYQENQLKDASAQAALLREAELKMKRILSEQTKENENLRIWTEAQQDKVKSYLYVNYKYFNNVQLNLNEFEALNDIITLFQNFITQKNFQTKKAFLDYQEKCVNC